MAMDVHMNVVIFLALLLRRCVASNSTEHSTERTDNNTDTTTKESIKGRNLPESPAERRRNTESSMLALGVAIFLWISVWVALAWRLIYIFRKHHPKNEGKDCETTEDCSEALEVAPSKAELSENSDARTSPLDSPGEQARKRGQEKEREQEREQEKEREQEREQLSSSGDDSPPEVHVETVIVAEVHHPADYADDLPLPGRPHTLGGGEGEGEGEEPSPPDSPRNRPWFDSGDDLPESLAPGITWVQ